MSRRSFGGSSISGSIEIVDRKFWDSVVLQFEHDFSRRIAGLMVHLNRVVSINTAVWSGETIVNWAWSIGAPDLSHRDAIKSPSNPLANGIPSQLSLGAEARRAANEPPMTETLLAVLAVVNIKVPRLIFLTNTGEVAEQMEFGTISKRTSGMLRLAMREAIVFPDSLGTLQSIGSL